MTSKGQREQVGVAINDGLQYDIIGKRHRGSFRKALRDYGIDKKKIDLVIDDLDCDRTVTIYSGRIRYHFAAL